MIMTFLNNFLHNNFILIPFDIVIVGCIGYIWWSEITIIFGKNEKNKNKKNKKEGNKGNKNIYGNQGTHRK